MALALPRLVALLGEGDDARYLGCKDNGHLSYSFAVLDRAVAKFEVHLAGNGYVHLRSCFNNKYWVRSSESEYAIVAGASEPIEDTNSWNCTLFKPEVVQGSEPVVTFQHVQVGQNVGRTANLELLLMPQASNLAKSRFLDFNNFVLLPKYVSFKDDRGKFYKQHSQDGHPYMRALLDDPGATSIMHETSYNRHGNYRFKNLDTGKYWRRDPNWIWADHPTPDEWNLNILFWPVKVNNGVVALRNLGNNWFIRRLSKEYKEDCLNADSQNIIQEAQLTVVEPVLRRVVEVIEFRLDDARIYDQEPLVVGVNSASNMTDTVNSTTLSFSRTETMSSTWSNSVSVTVGVTASFSFGIPKIGEGGIEISVQTTEEYQWGGTKEWSQEMSGSYTAQVPPGTEVMVKMVATVGKCDVPFTYRQTDTLTSGEAVTEIHDDGLFTGVNAYNFRFEATKPTKMS